MPSRHEPDKECQSLTSGELLDASTYPHPVTHLLLKETHLSWILLTGQYAYKLKKPVRFDFVDASTLERRRYLCHEELRLNRRFAPEIYVDVVPITRASGRLHFDGKGQPIEYAVRMREFQESQELLSQLEHDEVSAEDMRLFAERLAQAHQQTAVAKPDSPYGTFQRVRQPMLDNFTLLRAHLRDPRQQDMISRLEDWTRASVARLEPLIESRRRTGKVRECHGDLHARNIVRWQDEFVPFDCLEFDPALRWIDMISDVSFLFMDLVSQSHADLAHHFLSRYLEVTGDYDGLRLMPMYAAYLALVRAKVDALGAETAGPESQRDLQERLERRLDTAARFIDAPLPALLIMHGVTASGKSWLSERLIGAIPAVRIRSDLERKRLAGVAPLAQRSLAVGAGDYSAAATQATYRRLLACAEAALDGNHNIVVDAAFLDGRQREMFRSLAQRKRRPFLIVSCTADRATLAARLDARAGGGRDPSEATHAVLERQLRDAQPLGADEMAHAMEIDMTGASSPEVVIGDIRRRLAVR